MSRSIGSQRICVEAAPPLAEVVPADRNRRTLGVLDSTFDKWLAMRNMQLRFHADIKVPDLLGRRFPKRSFRGGPLPPPGSAVKWLERTSRTAPSPPVG